MIDDCKVGVQTRNQRNSRRTLFNLTCDDLGDLERV